MQEPDQGEQQMQRTTHLLSACIEALKWHRFAHRSSLVLSFLDPENGQKYKADRYKTRKTVKTLVTWAKIEKEKLNV